MKQLHSVPWAQSAVDVAVEVGMHAVAIAIVAAECATKLSFAGKLHDANIIARLLLMYFDKNLTGGRTDENDDAVKEVGFPILIKPNAGGFGNGMFRVNTWKDWKLLWNSSDDDNDTSNIVRKIDTFIKKSYCISF